MKQIIKQAIIDGYMKIWDIHGSMPIGTEKYGGKWSLDQMSEYYRWINRSMNISFGFIILSVVGAALSITFKWYSPLISVTPYFLFVTPMLLVALNLIKERINEILYKI